MGRYTSRGKRSFACNGRLVRELRQEMGFTQSDLARRSGYSIRLIGKAEAGKTLSGGTIEVLAEALSSPGRELTPEELIMDPISISKGYIAAVSRLKAAGVVQFQDFLADNLVLKVDVNQNIVDFQREYVGIDGLARYYEQFFSQFDSSAWESGQPTCKFFESGAEVIVWQEKTWTLTKSNRTARVTSYLSFSQGLLCRQEDRVVVT